MIKSNQNNVRLFPAILTVLYWRFMMISLTKISDQVPFRNFLINISSMKSLCERRTPPRLCWFLCRNSPSSWPIKVLKSYVSHRGNDSFRFYDRRPINTRYNPKYWSNPISIYNRISTTVVEIKILSRVLLLQLSKLALIIIKAPNESKLRFISLVH